MKLLSKAKWLWATLLAATLSLSCATTAPKPTTPTDPGDCGYIIDLTDKYFDGRNRLWLQRIENLKARSSISDWTCVDKDTALVDVLVELMYLQHLPDRGQTAICSGFKLRVKSVLDPEGELSVEYGEMEILKLNICTKEDL